MKNETEPTYKHLTPFKRCVLQNFPFIEADFDALTNYALLSKVVEYLNKVIESQNEVQGVTEETVAAFNNLYDYVHDYFDNLDVQEEINNKLDRMAESGALTEIIAQFLGLGALAVFDTESDMINASQLIKGSKCKTLGKESLGDGFGAYYNIDETGDIELSNGLFATLIENYGGNNYYDEITVEQITRYDTDCYIITIPVNDTEGNLIAPSIEYDTDTPLQHADKTYSTLTTNASLSIKTDTITNYHNPVIIGNGEVLNDYEGFVNSDLADNYIYLGIKADRSIEEFKVNNTTAQQLLNAGCINVFDAYYKLVEHGTASDLTNVTTNEPEVITTPNPRQCLGVKNNGDWIILTCDGRTGNDAGLTSEQTQEILIECGCYNAWNLDGGGSTSSIIKGSKINRNIDNNRTTERYIPYTLNFRKKIIDEELAKAYSQIGNEKQNALEQVYETVVQNRSKNIGSQNLNELTDSLMFAYGNEMQNRPSTRNGYFVNIPHSSSKFRGRYAKQFYFERDSMLSYERELIDGSFTTWQRFGVVNKKCIRVPNVILTSSQTYEKVKISTPSLPTNSNTNIITINNDDTFSFDSNGYGLATVRATIQSDSGITGGDKFISLERNGIQQPGYVFKYYNPQSQTCCTTVEFTFTLNNEVSGVNDKYALLLYGNANDKFSRVIVSIELN